MNYMAQMSELNDELGAEFETEFRKHGYLAKSMRHMETHIRAKHSAAFRISEELSSMAQCFYQDATQLLPGRNSHDPFCVALQIIPRALSAYQGAILTAERGMNVESMTLTRSVYETAFWIGYLHRSSDVARDTLFAETLRQELEVHRRSLVIFEADPLKASLVRQRMAELGYELKKYNKSSINIEDVAKAGGFGERYLEYRLLCGKAAHVNLKSTIQYLNLQPDGSFSGHVIGPDDEGAAEALIFASGAIIMIIEAMRWLTKVTSWDDSFQNLMAQYVEVMATLDPAKP